MMVCPVCWSLAAVGASAAVGLISYGEGKLGALPVKMLAAGAAGAITAAALKAFVGFSLCGGSITIFKAAVIIAGSFLIGALVWKAIQYLLENNAKQKLTNTPPASCCSHKKQETN